MNAKTQQGLDDARVAYNDAQVAVEAAKIVAADAYDAYRALLIAAVAAAWLAAADADDAIARLDALRAQETPK